MKFEATGNSRIADAQLWQTDKQFSFLGRGKLIGNVLNYLSLLRISSYSRGMVAIILLSLEPEFAMIQNPTRPKAELTVKSAAMSLRGRIVLVKSKWSVKNISIQTDLVEANFVLIFFSPKESPSEAFQIWSSVRVFVPLKKSQIAYH